MLSRIFKPLITQL